jgi:3-dehydroquinate synthase
MSPARTVTVDLGERAYDVTVGPGLLDGLGAVVSEVAGPGRRAVLVTDSNVLDLYGDRARSALAEAGLRTDLLSFPAGEPSKTLGTYVSLTDLLLRLEPPIDRSTVVVALGGGVVTDLAGFLAATALRGLPVVGAATTLLAAVDASVGGKTGVDAETGKNLVGAFHQPSAVVIDAETMRTLPPGELGNGLAECVKHGVIRDESLLAWIEERVGDLLDTDVEALSELIARNVAIKAAVVADDERESGRRAHLNFGHTLGHAIEAAAGYGAIGHGQAVSLGMVAACRIAVGRSLIGPEDARRVAELLARLGLPTSFADLPDLAREARDADSLRRIMARDKKARAGVVRFILPTALGRVEVFDDVTVEEVDAAVAALARTHEP